MYAAAQADTGQEAISLYLHIPFCKSKCYYCDFLSWPADEAQRQDYVRALRREIRSYERTELADKKIATVFIGGGTPSVLQPENIAAILEDVRETFHVSGRRWNGMEITMEMNPGTATPENCRAYRAMGISRISIGMQSTCDRELKRIGRIHDYETFLTAYQDLRAAGFENINIDLMAALPGQTMDSYRAGLEKVIALRPEHISAYSLMLEERTLLYEQYQKGELQDLPDERTERAMYKITNEMLRGAGYHRYEISNYAKEGYACRHNMVYWQRGDYLGLGLGASSLIRHCRYKNTSDIKKYLAHWCEKCAVNLPVRGLFDENYQEELCKLTEDEEIEEYMFLGLRMAEGVSADAFRHIFGREMAAVYKEPIEKYISMGLLQWDKDCTPGVVSTDRHGSRLRLTDRGIDVSNVVFADFLLH